MMRRKRKTDEARGREVKPLELHYDLDWRPPLPRPVRMLPPLEHEPMYKKAVKLTVTEVDLDREFRGERRGRLKLSTEDGMEYIWLSLSPNMHVTFVNDLFEAFVPLISAYRFDRSGTVDETMIKSWKGRTALFDLEWSRWDQGAAWTIKKIYPLP